LNREILISYAAAFVSFLLRSGIKAGRIKAIYLFGSVARGDFDKQSDVDIFVDTDAKDIDGIIKKALQNFMRSDEIKKFRLLGIENEISVKHGVLEEWELKESVKKEGIILFSSVGGNYKKYFLIRIMPIKNAAKRNKIIRNLAGRKEKERKEKGLIEELEGFVIDARIYLLPAEHIDKILRIFSKEKVFYEMKEVWVQ